MQRRGIRSTIVEKSGSLRTEGYMVDFFGSGYDAAERLNLLPDLHGIHYRIPDLAFLGSAGERGFSIPYSSIRKLFDGRHFNFMRGDLVRVLYSKLEGLDVRFGVEVDRVESNEDRCSVILSDGTNVECSLLVGADGVHSRVRALCFGDESQFLRYLHCNTAAFVIEHPSSLLQASNAFSIVYDAGMPGGHLSDPARESCDVLRTFVHCGTCTAIPVGGNGGIEHAIWRLELGRARAVGQHE